MNIDNIPKDLLKLYMAREITSAYLAQKLGVHPVTVRRNIKREPAPKKPDKTSLIASRRAWRATLSDLPATEIAKKASVSLTTAYRIRRQGRNNA